MNEQARDAAGFETRIEQYLSWSQVKGHSEYTTRRRRYVLRNFAAWCEERNVMRPSEVTRPIVERYQRHRFHSINANTKRPISLSTQHIELRDIRAFFAWLVRDHLIVYNPAADIEIPRRNKVLPRVFLTHGDVERVLTLPDVETIIGLRNRAVLETIYSTGLRRMEICNLRVEDVELDAGVVMVWAGKGRKDRVTPIGERACFWILTYLHNARPHLVCGPDRGNLFLTQRGDAMSNDHLSGIVRAYLDTAGVARGSACHLFRHSCATQMMENGADTRFIQALLGHSSLETTQIYTRVTIQKLKEVHTLTHPGAKLKPDNPTPPTGVDVNTALEKWNINPADSHQ